MALSLHKYHGQYWQGCGESPDTTSSARRSDFVIVFYTLRPHLRAWYESSFVASERCAWLHRHGLGWLCLALAWLVESEW